MRRALVLACVLACSCATLWLGAPLRSGGDQIRVPHARHEKAQVSCLTCHEPIYDAQKLGERASAGEKTCLTCHQDRKDDCAMCHTNVRARRPGQGRETPPLNLDHAQHIERTQEDCRVCHKALPEPVRTAALTPPMRACLSCHEHRDEFEAGRCGRCHKDLSAYPLKPVSSYSHAGDFVRSHGGPARGAPETCATCHERTFCTDCHAQTVGLRIELKQPERVDRDFIHRNDFLSRHAIEAAGDPALCRRCHGTSFCENCHRAQNLTPTGTNPRNPHPPGWAFPGSPSFHGTEARRDIVACASCHDQGAASICVKCHKVGGIGGNPHPPGFSDRHGRDEIGQNGMCAACHL